MAVKLKVLNNVAVGVTASGLILYNLFSAFVPVPPPLPIAYSEPSLA